MKKQFARLAAAFGLLSIVLLGGCNNPVSPRPGADIPAGKGVVRVETGADAARTAAPAVNFARYEYWFSKGSDAAVEKTALDGVFELDAGSYTVTVKAFVAAEDTEPATEGTSGTFTVTAGQDAGSVRVILTPVIGAGQGTLGFVLTFPSGAVLDSFALTRVGDGAEPFDLAQAGTLEAEGDDATFAGEQTGIGAGYWLARASLHNGDVYVGKSEVVHVYDNMTTALAWTFAAEQFAAIPVVSAADSGPGTLREAITRAEAGLGGTIFIDLPAGGNTITLTTPLPAITGNLTIEGNGATLTQSGGNRLLDITAAEAMATVRRLHFKGGRGSSGSGGAIRSAGELVLESCIFSDNQSVGYGGAIYLAGSSLIVKSCTFYKNSAGAGGVISAPSSSNIIASLSVTGNVFHGNTSSNSKGRSIILGMDSTVESGGYNVSDSGSGTNTFANDNGTRSGYIFADGDIGSITSLPISLPNFKPLFDSAALGRLPDPLPADYPAVDFYGMAISAGGASGAVQTAAMGYFLDYGVVVGTGEIEISGSPDADGLYGAGASVNLTAAPAANFEFDCWTINGADGGNSNPLAITMDAHKTVRAAFKLNQEVTVSTEAGLRDALDWQEDGNVIRFDADITLSAVLPKITTSITIEGNRHILTRTFAGESGSTPLLYLLANSKTVSIKRLHFKNGLSANSGGALMNGAGDLILESCIFSNNKAGTGGGALNVQAGQTFVKGCTFYNNSAGAYGGAIYRNMGGTITLTGNVFYGNTSGNAGNVAYGANITSGGYNVSDMADGVVTSSSAQNRQTASGYAFATDDIVSVYSISPVSFKPLFDSAALNRLPDPLPDGYPTIDFYGTAITADGTSGAAQTAATGYYLDYGVVFGANKIEISGSPNADGLYGASASVNLTAVPAANFEFDSWTINGADGGSDNPLAITMDAHKTVRAAFTVTVSTEAGLRDALDWQKDGAVIRFDADITLAAVLPQITTSITIEGNGHILTRTFAVGASTQLLYINSDLATVTIRRLHFKDGLSNNFAGAIRNTGTLTVESCIFSGNGADTNGGAIRTTGSLTVKGCTFYNNGVTSTGTSGNGGAICCTSGTVTLTGNLFSGNTAGNAGNVAYGAANITSGGYNVSNMVSGAITSTSATDKQTASGYAFATGDVTVTDITFDGSSKPISATNLKTLTGLPDTPADFPTTYFDGTPRTAPATAGAMPMPTSE